MEPRIVEKNEILLIGMPYFGNSSGGEFSETWERFFPHISEISNRANPNQFYGLEFYAEEMEKSHRWFYMPSVEVTHLTVIPMALVAKRLPAGLYAVLIVEGRVQKIGEGFGFLYHTWLPGSSYINSGPYDFELYEDGRFKGMDVEGSEIDLYIPIKQR